MRQSAISFKSKGLALEGVISFPDHTGSEHPALLVCHSHPMLDGNFNDPIVVEICKAVSELGIVALRFNFRGVGDSEGEFTNGVKEYNDVKSALDVLRKWPGVHSNQIAIAGYSLGAAVVIGSLKNFKHARAFALVAPTVKSMQSDQFKKDKRPRLVVAGGRDKVAPSLGLQHELDNVRIPVHFMEVREADHSMNGHELEVSKIVANFVFESLNKKIDSGRD